ncbi:two-component system phosphate regulon sensor histidine kinase PhoR [Enterococcus sp. PF1-24]|uniref:ATP-binding protein n=1 Tax=unclassified Enterococcus TaxID=2608891 RepID=UPI002474CC06|nr:MULTISPECIES: ATP-binding protein [unclassified Enterococcus]MDH6364153.1 two-component system phosphate regulon sensor histidine kinase PhoR [Enterococcus sp. PFB1-1]MDH6401254.1 two-component system phosphate regulon sensor histidine kinase PhoR [Enterococcus sp. PF1-24]
MTKKNTEPLLALCLVSILFFTSWYSLSAFFKTEVIQQQETYLLKKGQLLTNQLVKKDFTAETNDDDWLNSWLSNQQERITLLDDEGQILYDTYQPELSGSHENRPEIQSILAGASNSQALRESTTQKDEILYVALPIMQGDQLTGIVRIAEPTAHFQPQITRFRHKIFSLLIWPFLVIVGLLAYFIRQKNRPLETVLPVLKKLVKHPERSGSILQASNQWEDLYHTVNQLGKKMNVTYLAYTSIENRFYTLLNDLMIGVFIIDNQGRLLMANKKMLQHLNLQELDSTVPYTELIQDLELIRLLHQVDKDNPFLQEVITMKEPYEQILDISLRYFQESQEDIQLLGIAYDLTRIHQLEKKQRDFVGNVSHELKTPVTSLIGFTETLLDGGKDDPETLTAFLEIMQKEAYRLQELIQDILQLSRDEQSTVYEEVAIDLKAFIENVANSYQKTLTEKQLTLTVSGPTPYQLTTQIQLFQPIIKNLIENAIYYSSDQGAITITYQELPQTVQIIVKDTGIGIEETEQERIFERFYRVDKARSRNSGGTGLGLSIVKEYVELLGGKITVNSQLQQGTTFTVELPRK